MRRWFVFWLLHFILSHILCSPFVEKWAPSVQIKRRESPLQKNIEFQAKLITGSNKELKNKKNQPSIIKVGLRGLGARNMLFKGFPHLILMISPVCNQLVKKLSFSSQVHLCLAIDARENLITCTRLPLPTPMFMILWFIGISDKVS